MNLIGCKAQVLAAGDLHDFSEWEELIDQAPISDVYFRPGYVCAYEAAGHGKAIGLVLNSNHAQVLVPLLLRPLSDLPFAQDEPGFDVASPYGYGGLLPLTSAEPPSQADVRALLDSLKQWCRDAGVVSCFIRLHPLMDQDCWLGSALLHESATSLHYQAQTVAVDLTRWDSALQRIAGLDKGIRLDLSRATRILRVSWGGSEVPLSEALVLFRQIYEQRMVQLNAAPHYYFSAKYYGFLAERLGSNVGVALAWLEEELVGASLFLAGREFAHYHLSGTNEKGRKFGATTLLINAAALWARQRGCELLHLGGGVCGEDGVFKYKKGFGGPRFHHHTLHVIADESRYQELMERRLRSESLPPPRQGFFPQYRA